MRPGLLAGIGLTHLSVYDQRPGPDGLQGGCAHVHAITDEAYFVIAGTGAIDLHDATHGFRRVPLKPGSLVQFTPGTLHRAISDGGLQVVCVMGNAGLPERGDARIYFGEEADRNPDLYQKLWRLPAEKGLEGALERRDCSIRGYMQLLRLWETDRDAYRARLNEFVSLHADAMAKIRADLESIIQSGPAAWLEGTRERLDGLPQVPATADAACGDAEPGEPRLGMCGLLRPVHIAGDV